MPGYVVTVLATFALYTVFTPGPNPGQTWHGLLRYLTLTQIYTDNYLDRRYLHTGLSQMWSLAVEVSFYAVLPGLAYRAAARAAPRRVATRTHPDGFGRTRRSHPGVARGRPHHRCASELGRHVAARTPCVFRRRHGVGRSWGSSGHAGAPA